MADLRENEFSVSHTKCFWTWPFGHIWGDSEFGKTYNGYRDCVICGKSSWHGSYDGAWHYDLVDCIEKKRKRARSAKVKKEKKLIKYRNIKVKK